MIKTISVPLSHEAAMESVLKELGISFEKKELNGSNYWIWTKEEKHLLYSMELNETIAYYIGGKVRDKQSEPINTTDTAHGS